MTIREAINKLIDIEAKHGAKVELYFDCPKCGSSFSPTASATTITFSGKKPDTQK